MTTHDERVRAIERAGELLARLMNPTRTPRIAPHLRDEASSILLHFPTRGELETILKHPTTEPEAR